MPIPRLFMRGARAEARIAIAREDILLVGQDGYWYASLPLSELERLDIQGRYVTYVSGAAGVLWMIGSAVMVFLVMSSVFWQLFGVIGVALSMVIGPPMGGVLGYRFWKKAIPAPLWVMRRTEDGLEAVVPKELLQHYVSETEMMAIRAPYLARLVQQRPIKLLFRTKNPKLQKLQFASLFVVLAAFGVLFFFMVMTMQTTPAGG